jgi:hypothetical protein
MTKPRPPHQYTEAELAKPIRGYSRARTLGEGLAMGSRFNGTRRFNGDPDAADNAWDFMRAGGMFTIERDAVKEATRAALDLSRRTYLSILERWHADGRLLPKGATFVAGPLQRRGINEPQEELAATLTRADLEREIKRLRRVLGIKRTPPTIEERRAATRERVRKHRAA